jgi:hypothetical protein
MHRVVATAAGRQTVELRGRFASSNVMIEDFVDYDTPFRTRTSSSLTAALAACSRQCAMVFRS